jgi:pimeloyl-ACP methyl ester carboxylesterase
MINLCLLLLIAAEPGPVLPTDFSAETLFVKVGPDAKVPGRSKDQDRAVVLIHGLGIHLFNTERITQPKLRHWQQHDSALVKELSKNADVYAIAYGQNVAVDRFCSVTLVPKHILRLKSEGYKEIILVGHSAGGLIARHLIEDHPDLGVTRVIQVCAPNAGSGLAALKTARAAQIPFLLSLTKNVRSRVLEERKEKRIPKDIEFACVVGSMGFGGDGIVSTSSQWSQDLQDQGVPGYSVRMLHKEATTKSASIEMIAKLVNEPQPRCKPEKIAEMRKRILGY